MKRRSFMLTAAAAGASVLAGCQGETDHVEEFRENLEERGLDLNGVEMHGEHVVVAEFETENPANDIAAAGLAFVDQIDAGWTVERLDGIAREETDLGWHANSAWAHRFLDGELSPEEYAGLLNDTIEQVIVIESGDGPGDAQNADD